jgi:hypothetical protein
MALHRPGLDRIAREMNYCQLHFLGHRRVIAGYHKQVRTKLSQRAASLSQQAKYLEAQPARGLRRAEQVWALARRREKDHAVALSPKCFDLARKYIGKREIVAAGCQSGGVGRQGDRWQGPAIRPVANNEFGRKMLALRGAPAVACKQELASTAEHGGEGLDETSQLSAVFAGHDFERPGPGEKSDDRRTVIRGCFRHASSFRQ